MSPIQQRVEFAAKKLFNVLNDSDEETLKLLKEQNPSMKVANLLLHHYEEMLGEVKRAYDEEPEFAEGYRFMPKEELKKLHDSCAKACSDCHKYLLYLEKIKPIKKKKPIPPEKVVEKLSFLREYEPLRLKSVDPREIVGASILWTYNVKTKTLSVFNAPGNDILTIKGRSVFNASTSFSKVLRKPELMLKIFSPSLPRLTWVKLFEMIGTKQKRAVSSRINKDTVLLKVFR